PCASRSRTLQSLLQEKHWFDHYLLTQGEWTQVVGDAFEDWQEWLKHFKHEYRATMFVNRNQVTGRDQIRRKVKQIQESRRSTSVRIQRIYIYCSDCEKEWGVEMHDDHDAGVEVWHVSEQDLRDYFQY